MKARANARLLNAALLGVFAGAFILCVALQAHPIASFSVLALAGWAFVNLRGLEDGS